MAKARIPARIASLLFVNLHEKANDMTQFDSRPAPSRQTVPWLAAMLAGAVFTLASAATNLSYGIARSTALHEQIIWGAVAVAASLILAVAPSALVNAAQRRSVVGVVASLLASIIFGGFSVAAALGSATGGRVSASMGASDVVRVRADLMAVVDFKSRELAAMPVTRSLGELSAEIDKALGSRRDVGDCDGSYLDHPNARKLCSEVSALRAEVGRADRREKVESELRAAREGLASTSAKGTVANTDALAVQGFLAAVGIEATADTLNRYLVLLAVLVIELGGGLSFAVAGSLSHRGACAAGSKSPTMNTVPTIAVDTPTDHAAQPVNARVLDKDVGEGGQARQKLLSMVLDRGGSLRTTKRELANDLGCSPSRAAQVLDQLKDEGRVVVRSSKTGTFISLAGVQA